MVSLTIDGQEVSVPQGTTVLEAAKKLGIHIPTFCWHPKLKPVGACRMCYVEIEKMPKLQVSCATEVRDGMVVYTDSDQVRQGRRAVIEFTLINHPLDCPTCDKGGECDLQDLTFAHGYDDSRFTHQKTRFTSGAEESTFDEKRIGPEIVLNRNRCILCYRCVRANKEAFGEFDLGVYERGNIAEINAAPGEHVDNPFSGNLVEICPVGALTNSDWRYKIRVWLTETTPSICNYTSSGTNILFYKKKQKNRIYRVTSRPNDDIDDGWLSDLTRYGYQIANSPERLATPLVKKEGKQVEATWGEALQVIANRFKEIKEKKGNVCIGGLAAPNLDNTALHAFSKLFRTVLHNNNVDFRCDYNMLSRKPDSYFNMLCMQPFRIADIDDSDVIVTFATDLLREHHNEYLRIRKACNFNQARIFSLNPYAVKTADVAEVELVYAPGTDEMLINAVCLAGIEMNLVDAESGRALLQKSATKSLSEASKICGVNEEDVKLVARAIASGNKLTFIVGELAARSYARESIAAALLNLNRLFGIKDKGQLAVLARYANSVGAGKLGLLPEPPVYIKHKLQELWGQYPESEAKTTDAMMALMRKEEIKGFVTLGVNPVMLYPDRQFVAESLEKLEFLVACDLFENETTELADVVLPMSSWAEYAGDYVNLEGRVQRAQAAIKPEQQSRPPFEIINLIAEKLGATLFESNEQAHDEVDALLALEDSIPLPDEFLEVKYEPEEKDEEYPVPLFVCDDPHHTGHLSEKSQSLANFSGEAYIEMSPDLAAKYDLKENAPVRVESPVGKLIVGARISDWLENDVVLLPRNFTATPVTTLQMRKKKIDCVKLSKVDE